MVVPEGEPDFWHVWSARVSELLGRTLDETPAAIGVLDTELRYRYVNATLARLNGVPADEHVGRTVAEVVPGVEAREDVLRAVIADGVPRETVSSGHAHADSPLERRYLHGAYHRLSNEGRTMGIVGILLDVLATRQEQRELERAREAPRAARRGRHPGRYHPGHGHHLPATCVIAIADPAEGICIYASARRLPPRRPGRPPPRPARAAPVHRKQPVRLLRGPLRAGPHPPPLYRRPDRTPPRGHRRLPAPPHPRLRLPGPRGPPRPGSRPGRPPPTRRTTSHWPPPGTTGPEARIPAAYQRRPAATRGSRGNHDSGAG